MAKARLLPKSLLLTEHPSSPATPSTGESVLYYKADGKLYQKGDDGVERSAMNSPTIQDLNALVSITDVDRITFPQNTYSDNGSGILTINALPCMDLVRWHAIQIINASTFVAASLFAYGATAFIASQNSTYILGNSNRLFGPLETQAVSSNQASVLAFGNTLGVSDFDMFEITILIRTGSSLANIFIIAGIAEGTISVDTPANSGIYFRYSTNASDPGWVGVINKDALNQTVTGQVAAIATSTEYTLRIRVTSTNVFFSVNGGAEISAVRTNIESSAGYGMGVNVVTTENVAKTVYFNSAYGQYPFS